MNDLWSRKADAFANVVEYYDAEETGWTASVKWDGCAEIRYEHADVNPDAHLHICDLDRWIDRLTELRDKAKAHFKDKHPREWD